MPLYDTILPYVISSFSLSFPPFSFTHPLSPASISFASYNVLNQSFLRPAYYPYLPPHSPHTSEATRCRAVAEQVAALSPSIIAFQEASRLFIDHMRESVGGEYEVVAMERLMGNNLCFAVKRGEWYEG